MSIPIPDSIEEVMRRLGDRRYISDRPLATGIFLALRLGKPLFIEGEAGVGKTEAAKVMADVLGARLIRLQCYEGIDLAEEEFEASLLELLSVFQVSIPERGTIQAQQPPFVVITSNRTREVHDA